MIHSYIQTQTHIYCTGNQIIRLHNQCGTNIELLFEETCHFNCENKPQLAYLSLINYNHHMYLCIDIGGTKTLIALFSQAGELLHSIKFPTNQDINGFETDLAKHLSRLFADQPLDAPVRAVSVGVAAPIKNTQPVFFPNLAWPKDHRLHSRLENRLKTFTSAPIYFINDASSSAMFEAQNFLGTSIFLTFSTGIGGGIVEDGQLSLDSDLFEPGHWRYSYKSQKDAEWEHIASANALLRDYGQIASKITGEDAFQDIASRVSLGLIDIIQEYKPAQIIIGGALGPQLTNLHPYLKEILKQALPDTNLPNLIPAKSPFESVIHGCFLHAKSQK